ncbi:MAG: hypothetical protein SOY54_08745, partial [Bacilli bacterium]|nr:hypothetical protein [Bacilli bacterium]
MRVPELFVQREKIESDNHRAIWIDVCVRCLESLTHGHPDSIVHLHLVPVFYERETSYLTSVITPLCKLRTESFKLLDDKDVSFDTPDEIYRMAIVSIIEMFWGALGEIAKVGDSASAEEAEEAEEALKTLLVTFRDFRTRIPYRSMLLENSVDVPYEDRTLLMLDIEFIAYLFALNFGAYLEFREVKKAIMTSILEFKFEKMVKNIEKHSGLKIGLDFCKLLLKYVSADKKIAKAQEASNAFMRDVVFYYIEHAPSTMDAMSTYVKNDLMFVLSSMLDGRTLQKYITPMWLLQVLGRWLRTKSLSWSDEVLKMLFALVKDVEPIDMTNMSLAQLDPVLFVYYYLQIEVMERRLSQVGDLSERVALIKSLPQDYTIHRAVRSHFLMTLTVQKLEEYGDALQSTRFMCEHGLFDELQHIWADKTLDRTQLYLFTLFKKDNNIVVVCKWKEFLEKCGLAEFFLPLDFNLDNMFCPPFMISKHQKLYPLYIAVAELFNRDEMSIVSGVRALLRGGEGSAGLKGNAIRNAIRMMVVLVAYYNFFDKGQACPEVERAMITLQEELKLTTLELNGVLFFMRGQYTMGDFMRNFYKIKPVSPKFYDANDSRFDTLYGAFSYKWRTDKKEKADLTTSHLMANVLAYTLGCPSDSTHMYERIFKMETLNDAKCPGSAYNRNNWDCGFKMDMHGNLDSATPPIMHNNRQYRLALNTVTWMAFSWSQIVNPPMYVKALENHHFINHIEDVRATIGGRTRNKEEEVHTYIYDRACNFFSALREESSTSAGRIDQTHFINETLLELFYATNEVGGRRKPSAFVGSFDDAAAIAYENEFERLFNTVSSNYKVRAAALQYQSAEHVSAKLCDIIKACDFRAEHLFTPLGLNRKDFIGRLSKYFSDVDRIGENTRGEIDGIKFINTFFGAEAQYAIMRHLPTIVQFYVE